MGPCMCGDTHCSSCGPAQGNWKCPLCGFWADDGCKHFKLNGQPKKRYEKDFRDQAEAEAKAEQEAAESWLEEQKLISEYLNTYK